jgi:hypothetical protein
MPLIVPTRSTGPLRQQVTALEGTDYILTFAFNRRDGYWYLDIADQDAVPISLSRKCVVNVNLLRRCADTRKPPGALILVDTSDTDLDPGLDDLGTRVDLVYYTAAELAAG